MPVVSVALDVCAGGGGVVAGVAGVVVTVDDVAVVVDVCDDDGLPGWIVTGDVGVVPVGVPGWIVTV